MADLTPTITNVQSGSNKSVIEGTTSIPVQGGQPVKRDADGRYSLARANSEANAAVIGVCLNAALGVDQPIDIQVGGTIDMGTDLSPMTVGETYVVSANNGKIAPYSDLGSGNYVSIVGIAVSGVNMLLLNSATGVAKP